MNENDWEALKENNSLEDFYNWTKTNTHKNAIKLLMK
jgi:hypothetical protein